MVTVFGIKPHYAGFGEFQCDVEGVEYPFDSVEEYAEFVVRENELVSLYAIDADDAEMGDEDGERLASAIRKTTDAVQGGHGTIVAFMVAGDIQLESVDVR